MDIPAPRPVSTITASPATTGKPQAETAAIAAAPVSKAPPPPPVQEPAAAAPPDLEETHRVVAEAMRDYLSSVSRDLQFTIDSEAGVAVVTVRDAHGNIVRKIPGEEALQRLRRVNAHSGTLIESLA